MDFSLLASRRLSEGHHSANPLARNQQRGPVGDDQHLASTKLDDSPRRAGEGWSVMDIVQAQGNLAAEALELLRMLDDMELDEVAC